MLKTLNQATPVEACRKEHQHHIWWLPHFHFPMLSGLRTKSTTSPLRWWSVHTPPLVHLVSFLKNVAYEVRTDEGQVALGRRAHTYMWLEYIKLFWYCTLSEWGAWSDLHRKHWFTVSQKKNILAQVQAACKEIIKHKQHMRQWVKFSHLYNFTCSFIISINFWVPWLPSMGHNGSSTLASHTQAQTQVTLTWSSSCSVCPPAWVICRPLFPCQAMYCATWDWQLWR